MRDEPAPAEVKQTQSKSETQYQEVCTASSIVLLLTFDKTQHVIYMIHNFING